MSTQGNESAALQPNCAEERAADAGLASKIVGRRMLLRSDFVPVKAPEQPLTVGILTGPRSA